MPHVILLLMGGTAADRYRRDRLLQLASVGAGCAQAGMAAIVLTGTNPAWIFPFAVMNGSMSAFTAPATRGIVPDLVAPKDIQQANAYLTTARSTTQIAGPAAAGILAATVSGGWGIALDALSFVIAAACFTRVQIASHPPRSAHSLMQHLREGWAYFAQRPWIWFITAAFAVMNPVQMGAWRVLGPIMAERTFGAASWGLILSLQAVGLLVASMVMLRVHLVRPIRAAMMAEALVGAPMLILGPNLGSPT